MNKYVTPGTVDMVNEVELSTTVLISMTPDKKKSKIIIISHLQG